MGGFRTLDTRTVRWRSLEGSGLEHLTVRAEGELIVARSVVIGDRGGQPYGARYTIVCDPAWRARTLYLETTTDRTLHLVSDGQGHWTDGRELKLPAFDGCIDVDLAGTPFTNTLAIRRLEIDPDDGAVELRALYVPFDTFSPMVDEQRYRCLERGRFRYEAVDQTFDATFTVDEDGLVIEYPPLFVRV